MPKKKRGKRKPKDLRKTHKIRKSSGDLVAIQISVRVKKGVNKKLLSRELIEKLIRHKADTSEGYWHKDRVVGAKEGDDPSGMKLSIIRWRNPDRLADEDQEWRYADPDSASEQADAWGTLRRIIQKASLAIRFNR